MGSQIEEMVRRVLSSGHAEIAAAYLFGSHARNEAHSGSDVDLAVLFSDGPAPRLAGPATRFAAELERELLRSTDIVVLNRVPADLVHRGGILVCENDPSLRIRFEVAKRSEYFDLLPVLRRCRRTQCSMTAADLSWQSGSRSSKPVCRSFGRTRPQTGFRNVLVHGYTEVNLGIVLDVLVNRLGNLEPFVDAIRRRL